MAFRLFLGKVQAGADVTVTPGLVALTLTSFAPTVTAGGSQTVTPSTAALTLTTFAPTVTASAHQTVTPTTAALTLAAFAPTVLTPVVVYPGEDYDGDGEYDQGAYEGATLVTLTTYAPTVTANAGQTVTPSTAALSMTAFAPTVTATDHQVVTPTTAALTLTTYNPAVNGAVITPSTAALVLTTYAPYVVRTNKPLYGIVTLDDEPAALITLEPELAGVVS